MQKLPKGGQFCPPSAYGAPLQSFCQGPMAKYVLITPWCPSNRSEWYNEIIN